MTKNKVSQTKKRSTAKVATQAGQRRKNKIAKADLAERVARGTGLARADASNVVNAVIKLTAAALQEGRTVGLMGLGTFSITHTKERQGVRPSTTERIVIPAGKKVRFKPSTALKQDLNS